MAFLHYLSPFLGCKNPKQCECELQIESIQPTSKLILGQSQTVNVRVKVSNVGKEPAIGTKFTFGFPVNLPLIEGDKFHCNRVLVDNEGSGESANEVCLRSLHVLYFLIAHSSYFICFYLTG